MESYLKANEFMVKYCNKRLKKTKCNSTIRELKEIRKRSQTVLFNEEQKRITKKFSLFNF